MKMRAYTIIRFIFRFSFFFLESQQAPKDRTDEHLAPDDIPYTGADSNEPHAYRSNCENRYSDRSPKCCQSDGFKHCV